MDNRFLQLHLLTSYPPSNLNRDDLGRPKTAMMGGANRLRVSSQSLKRAWRMSPVFEEAVGENRGVRTKEMGEVVFKKMVELGANEKLAKATASKIAEVFGKLKKPKKDEKDENAMSALHIEQLAHFSPTELTRINDLVKVLASDSREPDKDELKLLETGHGASDIAMFGRMLAGSPGNNVEASVQVAHAIGVHKSSIEDDYFTAVDDLNDKADDAGAAHIGEIEFGAGLFYLYICVDRAQLLKNLDNDSELSDKTIAALVECAATVAPTGKQNTFASRAYASYVLAELGSRQPRSLSVAFLDPVSAARDGMLNNAITSLEDNYKKMDSVYGPCAASRRSMNAKTGEGSLSDLISFASSD